MVGATLNFTFSLFRINASKVLVLWTEVRRRPGSAGSQSGPVACPARKREVGERQTQHQDSAGGLVPKLHEALLQARLRLQGVHQAVFPEGLL